MYLFFVDDDVTGGIPPVVFRLESLNRLTLDYNAITMVPPAINNLRNLEYLSLNHNPLLENLPGSLGHLPNIRRKLCYSANKISKTK